MIYYFLSSPQCTPCLYLHQSFVIGLFPSHDPLTREYQYYWRRWYANIMDKCKYNQNFLHLLDTIIILDLILLNWLCTELSWYSYTSKTFFRHSDLLQSLKSSYFVCFFFTWMKLWTINLPTLFSEFWARNSTLSFIGLSAHVGCLYSQQFNAPV